MKDSDFEKFTAIIRGLADNFSADVTADGIDFRFECLRKYSIEQIRSASLSLVRTRKYTKMPTVADFIEAIDGNPDDNAEAQAMKVLEEIRRIGSYSSPVFEDSRTQRIVAQMGWGTLCSMETSKEKWFVKEFMDAYKSESRRQETAQISGKVDDSQVKKLLDNITKGIEV